MCLQPKHASSGGRIYASLVPPRSFVTAAMHLAVMSPAQRNRKLVADFPAKRRRLHKTSRRRQTMVVLSLAFSRCSWLVAAGFHGIGFSLQHTSSLLGSLSFLAVWPCCLLGSITESFCIFPRRRLWPLVESTLPGRTSPSAARSHLLVCVMRDSISLMTKT